MNPSHSRPPPSATGATPDFVDLLQLLADEALAAARRLRAGWRQRREARDTHLALQQLDERTLRDLGIHQSELWSLAVETHGGPHRTRALAERSVRAVHS